MFEPWRGDEASYALNRFGDKRCDVAAGAGLDEIFDVICASHLALGIFQVQRAAVAVRVHSMRDAHGHHARPAVGCVRGDGLGQLRAPGLRMAQSDQVVVSR